MWKDENTAKKKQHSRHPFRPRLLQQVDLETVKWAGSKFVSTHAIQTTCPKIDSLEICLYTAENSVKTHWSRCFLVCFVTWKWMQSESDVCPCDIHLTNPNVDLTRSSQPIRSTAPPLAPVPQLILTLNHYFRLVCILWKWRLGSSCWPRCIQMCFAFKVKCKQVEEEKKCPHVRPKLSRASVPACSCSRPVSQSCCGSTLKAAVFFHGSSFVSERLFFSCKKWN